MSSTEAFVRELTQLSPKRLQLLCLEMREQLDAADRDRREPIAIVGLGCRFPGGVRDSESFWKLLANGVDATGEVPADRWDMNGFYDTDPLAVGKMCTRRGGFLTDIDQFDPTFFDITPREAENIDPQQRLLLEVTWEALEHAGQVPSQWGSRRVGVYVGITLEDYARVQMRTNDPTSINAYTGTGMTTSVAAGRLSYVLGFQGPSFALNTACSSSLVTVHLAAQSLRRGECEMAVAGGVNLMLSPDSSIFLSAAQALSPDGLCKTFDARADGYSRAEGCGMVVLKRLRDAIADGDRVLATIRGSAINHDGHSSGLTVPYGPAQVAVIRTALEDGGVRPDEISYIEAHGTGTPLGDPIEVQSLAEVMGAGRTAENPLVLGSVKTNFGHAESAAGIAGLIKVVLAMQHRELPPHLHFEQPNPHLGLDEASFRIQTSLAPWQPAGDRRLAGVSSFGLSGTNAHVVLEEAPARPRPTRERRRPQHLFLLSAARPEILPRMAERAADHIERHDEIDVGDACFTASTGRTHFDHRFAAAVSSRDALVQSLRRVAAGEPAPRTWHRAVDALEAPRIAFLFTGQGAQRKDMGRQLFDTQPTFRRTLERCDEILSPLLGQSMLSVLYAADGGADEGASRIHETALAQPALFAVEYALAEMLGSWGVRPAALLGHSVGEYVAACVAGVFSLEDALRILAERGRLMQALEGDGAMVNVFVPEATARQAIEGHREHVSIAAINGPASTVLSGDRAVLQAVVGAFGDRHRWLEVSHAFHSPQVEPMLDAFERLLATIDLSAPAIPLISNLTGRVVEPEEIVQPSYWRQHVRSPVRFMDGIASLHVHRCTTFLELGPSPVLLGLGRRCPGADAAAWLPTLRPAKTDWDQILESVAQLHTAGVEIDWQAFDRDEPSRRVSLPSYPWKRRRFWLRGAVPISRLEIGMEPALDHARAHPDEPSTETASGEHSEPAPSLYYEIVWEKSELPAHGQGLLEGPSWLVLGDADGLGPKLVKALDAQGAHAVCEPLFEGTTNGALTTRQALEQHLRASVERHVRPSESGSRCQHVVYLGALEASLSPPSRTASVASGDPYAALAGAIVLLQRLAAERLDPAPRLWVVTSGAQAVAAEARGLEPLQSTLWGLGRTCAFERPDLWGGLVDLDPVERGTGAAQRLAASLRAGDKEDQVGFRGDERYVARVLRAPMPEPEAEESKAESLEIRSDGDYLITGGLKGLGYEVARWLVDRGARFLTLLGRSKLPERSTWDRLTDANPRWVDAIGRIRALEEAGASVEYASVDIGDEARVRAYLAQRAHDGRPPVRGVVHAAAVWADAEGHGVIGPLEQIQLSSVDDVLSPKVEGGRILERLLDPKEVDFFLLFSSVAALMSSFGQGVYAAANAYLDTLAWDLGSRPGCKALAINLGPVADAGFGMSEEGLRINKDFERLGIRTLPVARVMAALDHLFAQDVPQLAMVDLEWQRIQQVYGGMLRSPLTRHLLPSQPDRAEGPGLLEQLDEREPTEQHELVSTWLQGEIVVLMGFDESETPTKDQGLFKIGMDSLLAVELKHRIRNELRRDFPITAVFDHPTIDELTSFLLIDVLGLEPQGNHGDAGIPGDVDILDQIDQLSEEEAEALLAQQTGSP